MFNSADASAPGHYSPSQTALLLLDFHDLFVEKLGGPNAARALEAAASLQGWAQSRGIQVIHALIDIHDTPVKTCKDGERVAQILGAMRAGGGGEPSVLLGHAEDMTFTRKAGHVSALKSPGLEDVLQKKGIKSLILTGLSTSGCVLQTALNAGDSEFVVSVISDGCADSDQDLHKSLLDGVLGKRGYVASSTEFKDSYERAQGKASS